MLKTIGCACAVGVGGGRRQRLRYVAMLLAGMQLDPVTTPGASWSFPSLPGSNRHINKHSLRAVFPSVYLKMDMH